MIALPSTGKEGLPNVLLEALAMEKPCVATNKYGMPEVVVDGKTGYVFPSGDVDALADAIVKIGGVSKEEQVTIPPSPPPRRSQVRLRLLVGAHAPHSP